MNHAKMIHHLKQNIHQLESQISVLRQAMRALAGWNKPEINHPRTKLSAQARKRISRAQKARWSKWKKEQKKSEV